MAFGRKPKQEAQQYPNGDLGIAQAFNNQTNNLPLQNPINVPNIYQPSINQVQPVNQNQVQNQPMNNQVQTQRLQKQARIIKGEVNEEGEYYYIVVTNYPLRIDDCNLEN